MVQLFEQDIKTNDRQSSKGNQLKWCRNNVWYKADYMGYEGLVEYVVSRLLEKSSLKQEEYVLYKTEEISYKRRKYLGCKSENFLPEGWQLITLERLFYGFYNESLYKKLFTIPEHSERLEFIVDQTERITGISDFGKYMSKILAIDTFFMNEDRHMHNIGVLMDAEEKYHLCPIFDNGAGLLSDIQMDYPMEENNNNQSFHEQIEYLERITTNLHESVMKVRMVPIESVTQKYPRMIRDLSRTLNKKMNLVITGEDTELDRTVVDQIGDPLQHLLRNSADHGLESNEVRLERGKPEVGTIFLNAYQEGNNVVIKVGDDGNGIDTEAVKNKAIERGIVTAEQAENLSQKDIINFLFMPSFSMAKQITDISGRGVGLDVVKSGIEQLGGDVSVSTELGKGTTFTVRLPLTLAIIQALMVEIRDEIYAIALGSISNIEDIPVKDIKYVQAKEVIHLRGSVIPIIRLDKMLDIEPKEQEPDHLTVVIVQKGDQQAGLVVDNLIGQQEIVIKSLGKYINGNKLISGATILGDGDVALILDVNTLM